MPDGDYSAEARRVAAAAAPLTQSAIQTALVSLGVRPGDRLIVHSSLSALGWVTGGAHAVVLALMDAVTAQGTLVMPTHSGQLSEPSKWRAPPVPEAWWPIIRGNAPAYDPHLTPTRLMGAIVETFRHVPGTVRSAHPLVSFAAWGADADVITADHRLGSGMGEHSPLARLYERHAKVLLLGVGHGNNTSLHLAEYRATFPTKRTHGEGAPLQTDSSREWVTFDELVWHDDDFPLLGDAFDATGATTIGQIGAATVRLMPMRALVDFAVEWMEANRT